MPTRSLFLLFVFPCHVGSMNILKDYICTIIIINLAINYSYSILDFLFKCTPTNGVKMPYSLDIT